MPPSTRLHTVRACYQAYVARDREALESAFADDYEFFSPPDPGIDRATYFERCFEPIAGTITGFDFVRLEEVGDEVLVTYESTKADGRRFRNTEIHTFEGERIRRTEVYFGWDLPG